MRDRPVVLLRLFQQGADLEEGVGPFGGVQVGLTQILLPHAGGFVVEIPLGQFRGQGLGLLRFQSSRTRGICLSCDARASAHKVQIGGRQGDQHQQQ